jgi:2-C-methyl-D-erythritol 4-phosphate cytidylyltransferase/2-C-methyl-D-erythritol 2,4-cyclodiphosphate synthase
MDFSFIILAAGNSNRFKSEIPKQYQQIEGKTLIDINIEKIKEFKQIKKIVFVYNKRHKNYLKKIRLKDIKLILGGVTRKESTYNALKYLKKQKISGKVLIHDAARPNFSSQLLKKIIINAKKNRVVIPVLSIQDALKERKLNKNFVNLNRGNFFTTQTPQCFNLDEVMQLHKDGRERYRDDDFSLIDNYKKVKLINGEKRNIKITDLQDFSLLKSYYKRIVKIGIGFDVHRLVKGRKLFLGGIRIPSKLGTLGHSDGDPVLHALIDALLGACSMGDIGEKFSDKRKKYKNISSTKLIKKVISDVKKKGYAIQNIDINIITQEPKLKKFKDKITNNIADLCEINLKNINVKAKTTEKLGVIGREEAIAAEVVMLVVKYD